MTTNYPRQMHYQITAEDYAALRACLVARAEERTVRSVYTMFFASYRDRVPTSSIGALLAPEEMRFSLHYYDDDPTYLFLERQMGGRKSRAMVTEAECRALLAGETDWLLEQRNPLMLDFHRGLTERMLLPQMSVTYQREIYTADDLNLWVALDTDVRASLQHMDFLDPQMLERDTADQDGKILMEVSYSDRIPDDVLCLLEKNAPRRKLLHR